MPQLEHLRFQRLPPEAQRATLWRLAWSGMAPEQIATRIGWSAEQVRRAMHDELPTAQPQPRWRRGESQAIANA
jgi:DNA-directed RNA polymerase specialized sigma24 family protein